MSAAPRYVLISPCRNEAEFMRRTLDSVVAQTVTPDLWVIVNDGSTDQTPEILAEYEKDHDWIKVLAKPDRGHRAVGPGVMEAFYFGLDTVDLNEFTYLCKLDLDLDLPPGYFEEQMRMMESEPRLGTCSGKTYFINKAGAQVSEKIGDEMSVGANKFYRVTCFNHIGGFARDVMWDGLDCHKARQLGWLAMSWDDPKVNFVHLRPMGSSQTNILVGRRRHGSGQYYMGSDPIYFIATAVKKMFHPPYLVGGFATLQGFFGAMLKRAPQYDDPALRTFIRSYQRRALLVGKKRAVAEIDARNVGAKLP